MHAKKFPVTDTQVYISPVMLLFLRETGIHHLWLSNLTTVGRWFQACGPATEKALEPTEDDTQ